MVESVIKQLVMRRPHLDNLPATTAMPPGYVLQRYRGAVDLEPLAAVLSAAFGFDWDLTRVRDKITAAPDVNAVYIVTWQDRLVATASSRYVAQTFPNTGYIHWVATHPAHTQKHLATALMTRLLHDFRERGYTSAVLETDDYRLPAIAAYLKFGFVPDFDAPPEDQRERWSVVFQQLFG